MDYNSSSNIDSPSATSGLQYFSIPDSKIWKYNYREWRNIEINQARTLKFYEI
jgi:hypothetical protein